MAHFWGAGIECRKVKICDFDEMEWFWARRAGVCLVQLKQHHSVDRCVVLSVIRRVVLYSAERYPLVLSAEVLKLCGIDAETN